MRGPVFVTHRKPGPGKVVNPRDICPDIGLARLSYGQARMLLDEHTTLGNEPGTAWDLHERRHSGLTHLDQVLPAQRVLGAGDLDPGRSSFNTMLISGKAAPGRGRGGAGEARSSCLPSYSCTSSRLPSKRPWSCRGSAR